MKPRHALKSLIALTISAMLFTACGKREIDPQLVIPEEAERDLRKPSVPATNSEAENYPLFPQVKERGPGIGSIPSVKSTQPTLEEPFRLPQGGDVAGQIPVVIESILGTPENTEALQGAIATAMENAPAILEGIQGILAESGDGTPGSKSIEALAPEILESILGGDSELSPETVEQISGAVSEYAPAILDGILNQSAEGGDKSAAAAIAGMLFRKMMESKTSAPGTNGEPSNYQLATQLFLPSFTGKGLRAGLGRILDESPRISGEDFESHWQETGKLYRQWLYQEGEEVEPTPESTAKGRKGFSHEELEQVARRGGKVGLAKRLHCRIRYLTAGAVFGSAVFVDRVFESSRQHFGPRRQSGARRMRGGDWGKLRVLRDLQLDG